MKSNQEQENFQNSKSLELRNYQTMDAKLSSIAKVIDRCFIDAFIEELQNIPNGAYDVIFLKLLNAAGRMPLYPKYMDEEDFMQQAFGYVTHKGNDIFFVVQFTRHMHFMTIYAGISIISMDEYMDAISKGKFIIKDDRKQKG
jgi:hypothetical protein